MTYAIRMTSNNRDILAYGKLYDDLEESRKAPLSRHLKKKISAVVADLGRLLGLFRYKSSVVWDTTIFGPEGVIRGGMYRDGLPIDEAIESPEEKTPCHELDGPLYKADDLVDPLLYEGLRNLLSELSKCHIVWLATNRTLEHTYRCVTYDLDLWKSHLTIIFNRLLIVGPVDGSLGVSMDCDIDKEIDMASKDVKQAVDKINRCNRYRLRVIKSLNDLIVDHPIAEKILALIEHPVHIKRLVYDTNEARRIYTVILRQYLSEIGLCSDRRKEDEKKAITKYLDDLEALMERTKLADSRQISILRECINRGSTIEIISYLRLIFKDISKLETLEYWRDSEGNLDMFL